MRDESPASADAAFNHALSLRQEKRYREALELFRGLLADPQSRLSSKQIRHAYSHALKCSTALKDWALTESLARASILSNSGNADGYCRLGESLVRQGRFDEAVAALTRSIELLPDSREAPLLLELARAHASESGRPKVAPWPARSAQFEDPRALVERYVLRWKHGVPIIAPDSVFMTIGSCFALNLARHLREMGRTVHAEEIGEDINSTYANRYLLDWIENGATNAATQAIQDAYGPAMRERMRAKAAQSDVFVITLGVAPCFFRKDNGDFAFVVSKTPTARAHLYANHVMRTTSVEENVRNIQAIMDTIARLARRRPKFVLTVSPVPLGGTLERHSAVIADCVSKSTLRLAADQVCAAEKRHQVI
ncbi:MAG TPA: GSCFA domain-containing protein, partial [Caulobacteraceae bacterium]